jgi:hypothetical protein
MDNEVTRVVQAVYIAADPSQDRALHSQALEYLATVQRNASESWTLALTLFVEAGAEGTRKHPPQVRLWALRVLEDFLDDRCVSHLSRSFIPGMSMGKDGLLIDYISESIRLTRSLSKPCNRAYSTISRQNMSLVLQKPMLHVRLHTSLSSNLTDSNS